MPETIVFQSRLPAQLKVYGDIKVAIRKPSLEIPHPALGPNPRIEHIELVADVPADGDDHMAVDRFAPVFVAAVDLLSFQMATTIYSGQMEIFDVTPPIKVGEERPHFMWSSPPFDRQRFIEMLAIRGNLLGALPESVDLKDSKTAAVLRWFVKSLSTDVLVDQFMFLWIALEILFDASAIRVEEPYRGRCQHLIAHCPECGEKTTRMVRGSSLKAFLQAHEGITEEHATGLWRIRQLMHGHIPFDSKKLENLPALMNPLRSVVAAQLKDKLGMSQTEPPFFALSGSWVLPAMGTAGTGVVEDIDVQPLV
ncbi:hypothetical protein [Mycobacterium sp. C31M]